jgi:hypothetical protein
MGWKTMGERVESLFEKVVWFLKHTTQDELLYNFLGAWSL